jgi:hypothetical protein
MYTYRYDVGGDEGEDRNANSKNIRKGAAPEQNTKVRYIDIYL